MQTSIRLLAALSLSILIAGCTSPTPNDDSNRGPIGKADSVGSCSADTCGGPADDGNCWCDDKCSFYGDCCTNKVETCDSPQAKSCGGIAGFLCDDGDYCHYEQDQTCGAADQMGTCLSIPELCTKEFMPVCGCDGQTYGNSCQASASGTSVAHDGTCAPTLCLTDDGCGSSEECDHTECHSNCPAGQICPQVCWGECKPAAQPNACEDNGGFCTSGFAICPADTVASGDSCGDSPIEQTCCKPIIILPPPQQATCQGNCGGPAAGGACYCDDKCEGLGDCCDDFDDFCPADDREPASGMCVKNSNDECSTDADCMTGGCGGELCFNPAVGSGISTCECTTPTNVGGCGCVAGSCTWWN